jgi:transcriptional regulator with XRE-family HTH domain
MKENLEKNKSLQIGKLIQAIAKQRNINEMELAQRINCTRENIYRIYKADSVDVVQLIKLSRALNYDFLSAISEEHIAIERGSSFLEDYTIEFDSDEIKVINKIDMKKIIYRRCKNE